MLFTQQIIEREKKNSMSLMDYLFIFRSLFTLVWVKVYLKSIYIRLKIKMLHE